MRNGRSFFLPALQLRLSSNSLPHSRFAFVVSAHTAKRAVKRNLLKRRLRDIVRLSLKQIISGYDVLLSGKKPALELDYQQLRADVGALLRKARLLK